MSVETGSLEYFIEKFNEVINESKTYGIRSLVVVEEHNPIANNTETFYAYQGGISVALGLAKRAEKYLLSDDVDE